MNEKDLKRLFQEKLAGQEHPFNPANWQAMEKMLDQRKRSWGYYWSTSAAIVVLALTSLLFQQNYSVENDKMSPTPLAPALEPKVTPQKAKDLEILSSEKSEKIAQDSEKEYTKENTTSPAQTKSESKGSLVQNQSPVARSKNQSAQSLASSLSPSSDRPNIPTSLVNTASAQWQPIDPAFPLASSSLINPPAFKIPKSNEPYLPANAHSLSIQAGPSFNNSYNGTGSAGFHLGILYEYDFAKKWSVETGLTYNRSGDIGILHATDSTFFGLGRTEVKTVKHYKNLSSLRVPLNVNFAINQKHSLQVGVFADALLAISMDMQRTTTAFKQDPVHESHSSNKAREEFRTFNSGFNLGYRYQFNQLWQLGISYQGGLSDLTVNQDQSFFHRRNQTTLHIRYRLLNR
jgi:hypothetical protein